MSDAPLIVLGCGYVGTHVAKLAREAGRTVRVAARGTGRLQPLLPLGIEVKFADIAIPKQLPVVFTSLHGATVLYSVPPASSGPPGSAVRNALQAAYGIGANCFVYLSSSGMYGPMPDDDAWIDEDSPLAHDDPPMAGRQVDEQVVSQNQFDRLRTVVLRLAPVYGPKRGVRERLQEGRLQDPRRGSARDLAHPHRRRREGHLRRRGHGSDRSLLLVADDEPTTQGEYAKWLAERMGLPMPPSRSMYEPGASRVAHRNRKIRNARMKETLGIELTYPTYREGEAAIEAALARE